MKNYILALLACLVACLLFTFCNNSSSPVPVKKDSLMVKPDSFFVATYLVGDLQANNSFETGKGLATFTNDTLNEASGLGASKVNMGLIWVEEDSKNPNAIQLIDLNGKIKAWCSLPGIANRDWEDLCVSTGPVDNKSYVYVAEIGDNKSQYTSKFVYRFQEPDISGKVLPATIDAANIDKIELKYPDGTRNAEGLMVDPLTKDIYVVSKENTASVYMAKYPQSLTQPNILKKVAVLPFSTVTAADISPNGNEMFIKTYTQIFYWKKTGSETILDLLKKNPQTVPYVFEPQGEAICFSQDGSGFFTLSEIGNTTSQTLYFYKRK